MKAWYNIFAALLIISSMSLSLTACSDSDDNALANTVPNPLAKQLADKDWLSAYQATGAVATRTATSESGMFSYVYVIDVYEFTEDGKGTFYRYFFDEDDNLDDPDVIWGLLGTGDFTYTSKSSGEVFITLTKGIQQELPRQWTVKLDGEQIHAQGIDGQDITLEHMPDGADTVFDDWNDKDSSSDDTAVSSITKAIDDDVKGVTYTITKEEELSSADVLNNVMKSAMRNSVIGDLLGSMGTTRSDAQDSPTRSSHPRRHIEALTGNYRCFNITYESVDELGKPITLSARVMWPKWKFGREEEPNNIMLVPHFTIMGEHECPTYGGSIESVATCGDRILIMPDYIGYGASKDRVHPYINQNVCAQNSLDAMRAGYKLFKDKAGVTLHKDWRLYVLGMSQGGGNALAIHKWLDTHEDFANTWRFEYSYCCAGPYNPRLTFEKYFEQKITTYPVVLPATIKSMIASYPDILGKWSEDDFYSDEYLKIKEKVDDMIELKENTAGEINDIIFAQFPYKGDKTIKGGKEVYITDLVSKAVTDPNSELYKALMQCLANNDLTQGWTPKHDIYLFHSTTDNIVPYANAQAVKAAFPDKTSVTNAKGINVGHIASCIQYLTVVNANLW